MFTRTSTKAWAISGLATKLFNMEESFGIVSGFISLPLLVVVKNNADDIECSVVGSVVANKDNSVVLKSRPVENVG